MLSTRKAGESLTMTPPKSSARRARSARRLAREDAGLEAVAGGVGLGQRLLEVAERLERGDGREDLLRADAHLRVDVREHRRLQQRAFAPAAAQQPRAGPDGLV